MLAGEFLIGAILTALVALLFARRRRKICRIVQTEAEGRRCRRRYEDPRGRRLKKWQGAAGGT